MLRIALVIGLLGAVGPFAIDMYLPALPEVAADLGATRAGDAVHADRVLRWPSGCRSSSTGRSPTSSGASRRSTSGSAIFLVGTLGCALAPTIGTLIAARLVQGLGAATVMVVPRAIIRDLHTGPEATRLMAMVMLVISISPMLAPLAGSGLMAVGSWRLIFGGAGAGGAAEPGADRASCCPRRWRRRTGAPARPRQLARGFRRLLRDPAFMGLTLVGGFCDGELLRLHRQRRRSSTPSSSACRRPASASPSRSTPSASSRRRRWPPRSASASAWRGWSGPR